MDGGWKQLVKRVADRGGRWCIKYGCWESFVGIIDMGGGAL